MQELLRETDHSGALTSQSAVGSKTGATPRQLVWLTGAGGLIGHYLALAASDVAPEFQIRPLTRPQLDLQNRQAVQSAFTADAPAAIIHCAALSRSPACQADPALARKLNVDITRHLSELASDIPFCFFSSDLVFDGQKGNYQEEDLPNPLSVYAETKVEAERIVLRNPRHTVIRTSLNGGTSPTGDRGFNEELRNAWNAGQSLRLFTDEYRCPIPAIETARATWSLLKCQRPGLYHLGGAERLSRWHIGQAIAARWPALNPRIEPGSLQEYQGAPRPPDTSLNSARLEHLLGRSLPGLTAWLNQNPDVPF